MSDAREDDLHGLYALLRAGTSVRDFLRCYDAVFQFIKSEGLTPDYRLAKGRLKQLRDELTPAARFLRLHAASRDRVQFPLDSGITDCNWYSDRDRTIQITVVQARERLNIMTELNDTGEVNRPGFAGGSNS